MKPIFFMLVGLPYSGKTTLAEEIREKYDAVLHSSDAIRAEVLGDVQDQTGNSKVFDILHSRVIADLTAGKNVVYDATNINYKRRMDTLQRLKSIPCQKICVFMATPFSHCIERSKYRERVVPYEVLVRMYKSIWIPNMYEGWDEIKLVYPKDFQPYDITELFTGKDGLNYMEQDNPHHAFTVGQHCTTAYGIVAGGSKELQEAALLHDIGKPFTKTFVNSKGETTDVAHYYEHQHVSAYDSLFYANPNLDRLYIAGLIQWHMRFYEIKKSPNPKRLEKKFKCLIGKKMFSDLLSLYDADVKAH